MKSDVTPVERVWFINERKLGSIISSINTSDFNGGDYVIFMVIFTIISSGK